MSKNSARQTYQAFSEWRSWALARKMIKIKRKPKLPNFLKQE